MAVDWSLGAKPFDSLQVLNAYGAAQTAKIAAAKAQREQDTYLRQLQAQAAAGAAAARGDYRGATAGLLGAGDYDGAKASSTIGGQDFELAGHQREALAAYGPAIAALPAEQRAGALDQIAPQLERAGIAPEDIEAAKGWDTDTWAVMTAGAISPEKQATLEIQRQNSVPDAVRRLMAAGVSPTSPEGRQALVQSVNPPQYMQFGSDATGRQLVQTRGDYGSQPDGGEAPSAAAPAPQGGAGAPLSERLNNPGAMRWDGRSRWQGMVGTPKQGEFIQFDTFANGQRALGRNIANQARLHGIDTVEAYIHKYAPGSDGNNEAAYAARVRQALGVAPGAKVDFTDPRVVQVMQGIHAAVEGGGSPASAQRLAPATAARAPGGLRVVASTAPVAGGGGGAKAPSGYRFTAGGDLEEIPGGPAAGKQALASRKGEADLRRQFDALPEVKNAKLAKQSLDQISRVAASAGTASNDISLIFNFMRMQDPNSTVREGEFATAQNATGVPERVLNLYNSLVSGQRLNAGQRKEFVATARTLWGSYRDTYNASAQQYQGYAADSGLTPTNVARLYRSRAQAGGAAAPKPAAARPATKPAGALPTGWSVRKIG